jgi:hypothetical protein
MGRAQGLIEDSAETKKFYARRATLILATLIAPVPAAAVCDVAWDGDKVVSAIGGHPGHVRVPLKDKQQRINEVTVEQIRAFGDAKMRIASQVG